MSVSTGGSIAMSGEVDEEAPEDTICPVCHSPRAEYRCRTSTSVRVDDNWIGNRRLSTVSLNIHCHHPDTYAMAARARRYHHIKPEPTP